MMHSFNNRPNAHRIPVRVSNKRAGDVYRQPQPQELPTAPPAQQQEHLPAAVEEMAEMEKMDEMEEVIEAEAVETDVTPPAVNGRYASRAGDGPDWEALAKRQQADMENFRKRQQRRAEESVAAEKERLLRQILPIADNLNRALNHNAEQPEALRQGIDLTRRELDRILAAEGVTRIETVGHPFDPAWHDALATLPHQSESNVVIEEIEAGYKLGDKLLRPAKVVVAA